MEYFEKRELRRLLEIAHKHNRNHHLFLVTVLFHGLRVSEVTGQFLDEPENPYYHPGLRGIDICDGQLSTVRLKGSESTIQPIHHDTDPLCDGTPIIEMAKNNPGRLFEFSRQRADQFIKRYARLAGLHPSKAHIHALKHSIAMIIWDETHSLGQIRGYLGHKSPGSTMCYLVEADKRKAEQVVASIAI
jgi:site-specific recombinase XerC